MEGMTVDLRPEGLLNTATKMENLLSALILVRGNENTPPEHLPNVIKKLEWVAEEVEETLRILRAKERLGVE